MRAIAAMGRSYSDIEIEVLVRTANHHNPQQAM
jgi:hypothetical protein